MADLKDLASRYGVLKDKLNAQDFGPNDSIIASSLMHPQEAAERAGDWLQKQMRIAAGIPNQALEDEGSWYQTGIVPSMNEQAQAGLDLAGLMQTGAMPFAPASAGGTLGTFIGKNARNWDAQAAKLAEEKLNAGADPAEVWREHLIGRMPDKTLFSEISDSKFRLNNSNDYNAMIADKRKAMAENIAQQKEFESLKNAESPQLDLYPKEFKKAINEKINNLRNDRNYIRDELSGDLGLEHGLGSFEGQRVRNAFQHSDLINAYPELTNDSIIKQNRMLGSGVRGQLSGTNIDLSNNLLDYPDEAASTALHEFQHAIQNHEGWGKGSNPLTSQSDYYNFLGKKFKDIDGSNILSKFNELSGKSEPYYRIKQIQDLQNISQPRQLFNSSDYYKYSRELKDLLGAPPKYGSKLPWAQDAGNIIANKIKDELTWNGKDLLESIGNDRDFAKKMIRSIEGKQNRIGYDKYSDAYKTSQEMQRTDPRFKDLPNEEKMKLYQRSAGEAQARATQDRLDMDMAQRRENYPLAGGKLSDIPLEGLIYKYAEGGEVDIKDDEGGEVDSAIEDYKQLLSGYPNAEKFFTGLKDAAYRSVPTTEQMRDPNFIIDNAGFGGIIKPKGGNWLDAYGRTPEKSASEFIRHDDSAEMRDWLQQKLGKYIQNEMATPEDPVRRIAEGWPDKRDVLISQQQSKIPKLQDLLAKYEQDVELPPEVLANRIANTNRDIGGIQEKISELEIYNPLHYKPRYPDEFDIDDVMAKREEADYPAEGIAKTGLGKLWEHYADENIKPIKVYNVNEWNKEMIKEKNPWLKKLNDEDQVYLTDTMTGLGFRDLAYELRNATHPNSDLPDFLRIDPAKLSRVSMPQAVEHVANINAWRDAERLKEGRNAATVMHKEYPDQGLSWMQMRMPENQDRDALQAALKFEGDTMGHCVGQYCDEVGGGKSNIYSLRDRRGEPHVTIETKPEKESDYYYDLHNSMRNNSTDDFNNVFLKASDYNEANPHLSFDESRNKVMREIYGPPKEKIVQIKGKQNAAPTAKYMPAVHDFVRSKDWSSVGDLDNTYLYDLSQPFLNPELQEMVKQKHGKFATDDEINALQNEFYERNKDIPLKGFAKGGSVQALHEKYEESDYGYGNRPDKTKKGLGYFGELERPDGTGVMTEYSIGVPINGEEMDVPTLIPTLTPDEIRLILHMQDGEDMPRSIVHKAIDHAHQRLSEGKPIFATEEDLYAHGGIVDVLHNDAIEQIMKAFMDSMEDEPKEDEPAAVSIQITTQSQPLKSGKIPTSIREAKHG